MNKFITVKENKIIISIFLIFEFTHFIILSLTNYFSPLGKLFRFDKDIWGILHSYGNFDGFHYWYIAKFGYGLYEEAFFPLYPVLIKITGFFTNTYFINGLIISNLSFLFLLYFLYSFLKDLIGSEKSLRSLLFLLLFPTSFFFIIYYTESLFLLLFILCLYSLKNKQYTRSALFGYFCALTRFAGLFSVIPIFIYLLAEHKKIDIKRLIVLLSPIIGFLTYSLYLFKTKGDFLFFITAQPNFGANRSTHIILFPQVVYRYIKIFLTFKMDSTYYIAILESTVFVVFLSVLLYQLYNFYKSRIQLKNRKSFFMLLGLNLFSLVNLLLPSLSGTFSSIPRYGLLSLSFFIFIGSLKSNSVRIGIFSIFIVLHVILFSLFLRGNFIG